MARIQREFESKRQKLLEELKELEEEERRYANEH